MKLSVRLFLGYFLILAATGYLVLRLVIQQISPGVRAALEASLVDTANLLAELAANDMRRGDLNEGPFAQAVRRYAMRPVAARIFDFSKRSLDYRVYVTDARGIVRFDSAGSALGQDYSRWNDVYLTLRGDYGARSTQADPNDPKSSVLHVAAPVYDDGTLIGVLTVAYPAALLQPIVEGSAAEARLGALWLFGAALAFGALFNWRLTRAIDLLVAYAQTVAAGGKTTPPRFRGQELATLAHALETMREELEGKQYAERYVQTLTHEMKSPLAAMRGAAELLEDELPEAERRRFALLAREQVERMNQLIEKLLGLAALEQRQELAEAVPVELGELLRELLAEKAAHAAQRRLRTALVAEEGARVLGERFLLRQALSNLIDNALEFSPAGGLVECRCAKAGAEIRISVRDCGPGIPDYAQERLFERFYSLPRPDTGKKSTGLGLAFVREVALLHRGRISVANAPGGGAEAILNLPAL